MPSSVPATLKSMSPAKSSAPWMSERITNLSPSVISPMAMPATGFFSGTPASIKLKVLAQTLAILVEPLLVTISDTVRIVYGKSSTAGIIGSKARSASAP